MKYFIEIMKIKVNIYVKMNVEIKDNIIKKYNKKCFSKILLFLLFLILYIPLCSIHSSFIKFMYS
ncbi:hypothetical protein PFBG_02322 [Plasmodium falciparum 7G8]|uniref:Uncharacterized protein n=3 Tax=Plasmodium falciparum TaxID=5833 RepID=A0A024W8X4_PLAFA|nr:hypothetical protein PFTANZ_02358 [Plasmodium falciparum Tanzania (2000708)]ETW45248.1 hypothetical protein PFNF135_00170 [Plasmodium falciparum NF135/5.C10]EUR72747.1 hypothetical protein PFBG_02322 [Plasmodium falciparum 7G8]